MPTYLPISKQVDAVIVSLLKRWDLSGDTQYNLVVLLLKSEMLNSDLLDISGWLDNLETIFMENFAEQFSVMMLFPLFMRDVSAVIAVQTRMKNSQICCAALNNDRYGVIPFAQSVKNLQQHLPELYESTKALAEQHGLNENLAATMAYCLVCYARCSRKNFNLCDALNQLYFELTSKNNTVSKSAKLMESKKFTAFRNDLLGQLCWCTSRYGFKKRLLGFRPYMGSTLSFINRGSSEPVYCEKDPYHFHQQVGQ